MDKQDKNDKQAAPAKYEKPVLKRWGTLRELTQGGGGTKNEPATKSRTRF